MLIYCNTHVFAYYKLKVSVLHTGMQDPSSHLHTPFSIVTGKGGLVVWVTNLPPTSLHQQFEPRTLPHKVVVLTDHDITYTMC